jgi:hypothetical protein
MDIFLLSNIIITIALIIQVLSLQYNNSINPYSFLLLSLSTFIMAYAQYKYDNYKYNVPVKILNGILAILVFVKVY